MINKENLKSLSLYLSELSADYDEEDIVLLYEKYWHLIYNNIEKSELEALILYIKGSGAGFFHPAEQDGDSKIPQPFEIISNLH